MAQVELWTYRDEIERLLSIFDLTAVGRQYNIVRTAILGAYRDFPTYHPFKYFHRHFRIATVGPYATGTVAYDHTGGANERQLTLTDGTWPDWAGFGRVTIGTAHYTVASRISNSVLVLSRDSNPGADVAAGTSYTLFREGYVLPIGFRRAATIANLDHLLGGFEYAEDGEIFTAYRNDAGRPRYYTYRGSDDYYGSVQLVFSPPPDGVYNFEAIAQLAPRPLVIDEITGGTVSVADSTTTAVVGSSTAFTASMVGSVIRFSANSTDKPTGQAGGLEVNNPYVVQRVIVDVDDATHLFVDAAPGQAFAGVKYTISDPLDLEAGTMLSAFQRLVEWETARALHRSDQDLEKKERAWHQAMLVAKTADYRHRRTDDGTKLQSPHSLVDMRASADYVR